MWASRRYRSRLRRIAAAIAILLCINGIGDAAAQDHDKVGQVSNPAEIERVLLGNTLSGTMQETGQYWVEYYCATGKSIYYFDHHITLGKWRLDGDRVCFRYDWDAYAYEGCYQMFMAGDRSLTMVKVPDAVPPATFISGPPRPGDPLDLESQAHNGCKPEPSV